MKYILFLIILTPLFSYSQADCGGIINSKCSNCRSGAIPNSSDFIPNANTPNRIIKLNLHYMLNDDGTGNFTENTDGNGLNSYNGYLYSYELIATAINQLNTKPNLTMPPNNSIANLPVRYSYEIEGIYFHRDSRYQSSFSDDNCYDTYAVNKDNSINIFFTSSSLGTGVANLDGQRRAFIHRAWERYVADKSVPASERWGILHVYPETINHEVGHNLSLYHTVRLDLGTCDNDHDDFCDDTPTRGAILNQYGYDICCSWSPANINRCSNNLMDYTGSLTLSPCQLGRVHWTIMNELPNHRLCSYQNTTAEFNNLGYPQVLYQARTLQIGNTSGQSVLLSGEKAVFVGETSVELRPGFEAQLGSEFEIRMQPGCN